MRGTAGIFVAWLVFTPIPADAQEPIWETLAADDGTTALVEIDRTRVGERDGQLSGWLRLSFAGTARGRIQAFRSAVALYAFDCAARRYAVIGVTTYSEPLGEGDVIDRWDAAPAAWEWHTFRPDAGDQRMLAIACDRAPAIPQLAR